MKIQPGQTILLTGASGGLGAYMARAFARRGTKLALVAYPGADLESVLRETEQLGARAIALSQNLADPVQRHATVDAVRKEFGKIDILVNNAGVEFTAPYHELSEENIRSVIAVN